MINESKDRQLGQKTIHRLHLCTWICRIPSCCLAAGWIKAVIFAQDSTPIDMQDIILHLGSNLGLRHQHLLCAKRLLAERLGLEIASSGCYETSAWGVENQRPFLNLALHYQTTLSPQAALKLALNIENEMGRQRNQKWGTRSIDIDLIFYADQVIREEALTIPHPWMQERRFVLVPLTDIVPHWQHPVFQKTVAELLVSCTDQGSVKRVY
jgi:2-amino-4-hydroxy-6-hydroxymethyldihydropteridine diphosphokinase